MRWGLFSKRRLALTNGSMFENTTRWRKLILLLPALWPLFNAPFFSSHDGMLHLWRLWEFDRLWSQGLFIGRWAPDFHFAFGSPIFSYYNPLPYVIGEFFMGWGLATHNAIKLILALSMALSFAGMFLVGREWFSGSHRNRAGLLAATLYTYTPYILNDVYTRLALGECLALGLTPFLIWSLIRFRNKGDSWALPLISLFGALTILTHSLTAMLWAPFLAVFLLLPTNSANRGTGWRRALGLQPIKKHIRILGALGLGVLMAAFFLAPMLNGLENIQLENAVAPHGEELFRARLVSPLSYLQLNLVHDYSQDFFPSPDLPEHNPHFGLVITFFVLMGIIWFLRKKGGLSARNIWLLATLIGCIYLLSPFSRDVWSYLPGLATVQFPWRLLIIISFVASLLGASLATAPWLQKDLVFLSTLAIIVVAGIGGLLVSTIDWQSHWTNAANVAPYERQTNNVGMTSNAEFLPRWVTASIENLPWVHGDNAEGNEQDGLPDIELLEAGPLTYRFAIRSSAGFPLTLDQFYFPSWEATLDDSQVETYPAGQVGLLAIDVPPGSHELTVSHELSPATAAASVLSIGAWLIWVITSFWLVGNKKLRLIMAGGLALVALVAAPSLSRALGDQKQQAYTMVSAEEGQLAKNTRLSGYRTDTSDWMTSGLLGIELFLHAVDPIVEDNTIRVIISKKPEGGLPLVDSEHLLSQGLRPVEAWGQGQILRDRFFIRMPDR
jgi:hypothetical protein